MSDARRSAKLPARLAALEERVALLEREVASLKPAPRPAPAQPLARTGLRCPGCSLPVRSASRGTCKWCGFVFDTAPRRAPAKK